jgi:hypothetical protein
MNDMPYLKRINPKIKAIVIILGLIVLGIILGYVISLLSLEIIMTELDKLPIQIPSIRIDRSITYYTGALICLAIQITLLIGLLYAYVDSYRQTKSQFLIGLNMFIIALLIRSILSVVSLHNTATEYIRFTPFVSRTFLTLGFSELNFIVYAFEIIALSILLYLSLK